MDETLKDVVIEKLIADGDITKESARDYKIRKKYSTLRKSGLSGKDARMKLADEYCLSEKAIQRILYKNK